MLKTSRSFLLFALLALGSLASAQGFNFGVGFGFLRQDAEGNILVSVPLNVHLLQGERVGLGVRTNADLIISPTPDVSLLFSPLLSYTLRPTNFTPVTLYGGPSMRLFIEDAFTTTRQSTWSFAGGIVGASVSLAGIAVPYGEAVWTITPTETLFSIQTGVGFRLGL
jgi:hypothetical protein